MILKAAARCFAREGFHVTSVTDVIEASGLSAGSVYRYFKNKDDLIEAIIDRYLQTVINEIQSAAEATSDPAEAVVSAIKLVSKRIPTSGDEPFTRLLPQIWSEAMRDKRIHERGQSVYLTLLASFEGIIRRAQAEGNLPADFNANGTAHIMLALVQGYILQTMLMPNNVSTNQYSKTVRQLFSSV